MSTLLIKSQRSAQRVELEVTHDQIRVRIGTRTNERFIANFFRKHLDLYGHLSSWSRWDENIRFLEDGMRRSGFDHREDFVWVRNHIEDILSDWCEHWDENLGSNDDVKTPS